MLRVMAAPRRICDHDDDNVDKSTANYDPYSISTQEIK